MGFYYLKSRYYDPEICRFINADGIVPTDQGFVGCNLFAYCNNNPARFFDDGGHKPKAIDPSNNLQEDIDADDAFILGGDGNLFSVDNISSGGYQAQHLSGTGSPQNNGTPNGSYTKYDNQGNLYSYTEYDSLSRQSMRIDFQGRPHAGVLPHIHVYSYYDFNGEPYRIENTYDLDWNKIGRG